MEEKANIAEISIAPILIRYGVDLTGLGVPRYAPEQIDLPTLYKMYIEDSTCHAAVNFVAQIISARVGRYAHPDEEIEGFVNYCFAQMEGTLGEALEGTVTSVIWAGFSIAEIVYQVFDGGPYDGRVGFRKIKPLHPLSFWPRGIEIDEHGNVKRLVQRGASREVEIPLDKALFLRLRDLWGTGWGLSLLQTAYKPWFLKDNALQFWMRMLEDFGIPGLLAFVPGGVATCPLHGVEEPVSQIASEILQELRGRASMGVPSEWRIEQVPVDRTGAAEAFREAVQFADRQILRALLIPPLVLDEPEHGTRAMSQVHLTVFGMGIEMLCRYIRDALIEQLIRRLLDLNFEGLESYGEFVSVAAPTIEERGRWASIIRDLTDTGWLDPGRREDRAFFRELLGLPPEEEEEAGG